MSCHEVSFAGTTCRVEINQRTGHPSLPLFSAEMWVLDRMKGTLHQLVSADGRPVAQHGSTEALALTTAITFLQNQFGGLGEYAHRCVDFGEPPRPGMPLVIDGQEHPQPPAESDGVERDSDRRT